MVMKITSFVLLRCTFKCTLAKDRFGKRSYQLRGLDFISSLKCFIWKLFECWKVATFITKNKTKQKFKTKTVATGFYSEKNTHNSIKSDFFVTFKEGFSRNILNRAINDLDLDFVMKIVLLQFQPNHLQINWNNYFKRNFEDIFNQVIVNNN